MLHPIMASIRETVLHSEVTDELSVRNLTYFVLHVEEYLEL
jgi:hypothetical protein